MFQIRGRAAHGCWLTRGSEPDNLRDSVRPKNNLTPPKKCPVAYPHWCAPIRDAAPTESTQRSRLKGEERSAIWRSIPHSSCRSKQSRESREVPSARL